MKFRIKGELLGLDGEWELDDGQWKGCFEPQYGHVVLKRVPEKSELQEWAESNLNFSFLKHEREERFSRKEAVITALQSGFKKAIEVAEGSDVCGSPILAALKRFAGLDK